MSHYLRKLYADEPLFIPYSTKKKHPEIVAKVIMRQNKNMAETYVIVIVGLNREVMEAVGEHLKEVPGFHKISNTNKTDTHGRWYIMVKQSKFKEVRKMLNTNFKAWLEADPDRLKDTIPAHFPSPQVNQKHMDNDND